MIEVLKIVNTHGVKGEVKALHFTDGEEFFNTVKILYSKDALQRYEIENWHFHKGAVLVKFKSVTDMNVAERMKGISLYAKEEDLPKLPEGRYYYFQLTGLKAILPDGSTLGIVSNITDGPGGEMLEIKRDNGKICLIPKCDAFVKEIAIDRGEILITPIKGLIDDEI